uniref:CUB domain-containing protein n=1 Tax=Erpetoichthys calabaricus TaxID=27687 RepID=A0A8C4TM56_ERPCA
QLSHVFLCLLCLTGPQGSFNSPGFPNKYPDNKECIWHIQTAAQSHRVLLTFNEFEIENHNACNYDYLAVSCSGSSATVVRSVAHSLFPFSFHVSSSR